MLQLEFCARLRIKVNVYTDIMVKIGFMLNEIYILCEGKFLLWVIVLVLYYTETECWVKKQCLHWS